jgi:hypothetical protein
MSSLVNEVTLIGVINGSSELVGTIQSAHFLCGTINSEPTITGTISGGRVGNLQGVIQSNGTITGNIAIVGAEEIYNGDYIVTPKTYPQSLSTKNKLMKNDVSILEIPYYETSNLSGKTVYIGGE